MGKLDGKLAAVMAGSSGMALAGAKLFVERGAHVFISGRRQEAPDNAVKLIGRNVTGVQADSANLDELDHFFDAVRSKRAPSTCCGQLPGRARSATSTRSRTSTSMPLRAERARHALHGAEALPLVA